MSNLDDQAQIRADHESASLAVALLDLRGELDLLLRCQERDLADLAQVNLYSGIAIFSSHITFHETGRGLVPAKFRLFGVAGVADLDVLALPKVVNNLKYRNSDSPQMCLVQYFSALCINC